MVISQRRVDFGRGQRGHSLANLLDGQSQFPPTRHSVDSNTMAFNAGFSAEDAGRVDDHGTQLSCRCFRDCTHVQNMLVLGRCVKPTISNAEMLKSWNQTLDLRSLETMLAKMAISSS